MMIIFFHEQGVFPHPAMIERGEPNVYCVCKILSRNKDVQPTFEWKVEASPHHGNFPSYETMFYVQQPKKSGYRRFSCVEKTYIELSHQPPSI